MTEAGGKADLNAILRSYLRDVLEGDGAGGAVPLWGVPLAGLEAGLADTRDALAARDTRNMGHIVDRLMQRHGPPEAQRDDLAIGVLEAQVRAHEEADPPGEG